MRYMGGKHRLRKEIAKVLTSLRKRGQTYFEPFVGGGWVLQEMTGKRIGSDGNDALVAMYQGLQAGWIPPDHISEEEYRQIRDKHDRNDPLTAFCAFGCAFAGKWFGTYARGGKNDFAAAAKRGVLKQLPLIADVEFRKGFYWDHKPKNMLVYCDPPYQGTTGYDGVQGQDIFDHHRFWDTMQEWSKTNTVVISEARAPRDFVCIKEFSVSILTGTRTTVDAADVPCEKLFQHKESL